MSIESNNSYSKYNRFTDYGLSDVYMEVPEDVAGTEDKDDMVEQLGSEEEDHDHDDSRNDAAFLGQAIFDDPEVF